MIPQTHMIISEYVYNNVKKTLGVQLNKNSLLYGSVKPDIAPSLKRLKHFKPQSLDFVCNEIVELSNYSLISNKEFIKLISRKIGVITHFVSDFFCVPHNDRKTYQNNFYNHFIYESKLHKIFKYNSPTFDIPKVYFNFDNYSPHCVKNMLNQLHNEYTLRGESLLNDFDASIQASSIIAIYIVYHSLNSSYIYNVA